MAYDIALEQEVREALPKANLIEKRVFGGLVFMVQGKMCISVNTRPDHIMMVRVDPKKQEEALKRSGAHIMVMRGKEMPGWI